MTIAPHPPLISIIMPLYNGDAFLDAAVESVLAQSYTRWELCIIDDGSRDEGLARARGWAATDERIRVLRHEGGANRGVSETRNLGVRETTGPWIALLDCDDVWLPHKLERQVAIAHGQSGLSLIYAKAQIIDDEGHVVSRKRPGMAKPPVFGAGAPDEPVHDYPGFLAGRYWPPASSAMFPREAAAACGNFDPLPLQVEDTLLFLRLSTVGAMWFTDEVLVHYRIHGNQWNSASVPSRKAAGRFCYLKRLTDTVDATHHAVTAESLVNHGLRGLARALISPYEIRPLRLLGYLGQVLADSNVPWRLKARSIGIVLTRLIWMPGQIVILLRYRAARKQAEKIA